MATGRQRDLGASLGINALNEHETHREEIMPITKQGFKRLHKLFDFMESLPRSANNHFSMRGYIEHASIEHRHELSNKPTVRDLHACGTTACALGWATTVPALRRAGLTLDIDPVYGVDVEGSYEVFGIDYEPGAPIDEWDALFGPENEDKTPKAWAKRVRKLLKQWQAEA